MAKKRSPTSTTHPQVSQKSSAAIEDNVDFEESLQQVEQIVARLEGGELGLTESLEQYESGIRELKRCHALLEAAEQRVSLLSGFDADGNPVTEPFDRDSDAPTSPRKKVRAKKRVPTPETSKGKQSPRKGASRPTDSVDDSPGLF